jgi:hypothetical protein
MFKILALALAASSQAVVIQHALTGAYVTVNSTGYGVTLVQNPQSGDLVDFEMTAFPSKDAHKFIGCSNTSLLSTPQVYPYSGFFDMTMGTLLTYYFNNDIRYLEVNNAGHVSFSNNMTGTPVVPATDNFCRGSQRAVFERSVMNITKDTLTDGHAVFSI